MASAILINTCPIRLPGPQNRIKEGQLPLTSSNNHFCCDRVSALSLIVAVQPQRWEESGE